MLHRYDLSEGNFLTLLRVFYTNLFPCKEFYQWFSYGNVNKNYFPFREFSFTLASEVYIRFQSFATGEEFRRELLRLCPVKIDIGAVFNLKPKDKKLVRPGAFQPMEKELCFDIDMTDYDEIRTCCRYCPFPTPPCISSNPYKPAAAMFAPSAGPS